MFHRALITLSMLACLLVEGCAPTQVRVVDDQTGNPIAGVLVTPVLWDFMGNPTSGDSRTTDAHGQAILPYPRRDIMDFDTAHPAFRVFHPNDKPQRDGDRVLLYMRRPPRIVLVLPPDFTGPLPISSCAGNRYDRRQPLYRFAINPDPFIPTPVSQIQDGTVRLEEIEAERAGAAITAGAPWSDPAEVHVWAISDGAFYENEYIDLLFIGTKLQFAACEKALKAMFPPSDRARQLDRRTLVELHSRF